MARQYKREIRHCCLQKVAVTIHVVVELALLCVIGVQLNAPADQVNVQRSVVLVAGGKDLAQIAGRDKVLGTVGVKNVVEG